MKLTRIEVNNFKSISRYDFPVTGLNFFVGQNNHGKTNLFDSISWFDSGKTIDSFRYMNDLKKEISVKIHYSGVQAELDELEKKNPKYAKSIRGVVETEDEIVVEKTSANDKRQIIINGVGKGNPTGFENALNYFLPKIEYVTTQVRLKDVAGYRSKSPISEMLSGVLEDVVQNDPKYTEFVNLFDELFNTSDSIFRIAVDELESGVEKYLLKQFPDGASVDFKVSDPKIEEMLKGFETEVDDGIKTKVEEKGDGMQRAVMLAIIQAYADYRKQKKIVSNFVFLIDEAELHLHPSGQRSLKEALKDMVENGGQVLVNTHSSIFINQEWENQNIFNVIKSDKKSELEIISGEQERLNSIYNLLGGSPNDLLLPRAFIIVEGQSEYRFLEIIIKRFYSDAENIKVLFARGDSVKHKKIFYRICDCYTPLHTNGVYRENTCFLIDAPNSDQADDYKKFRSSHDWLVDDKHIFLLSTETLEEYYPAKWRKNKGEISYEEKVPLAIKVAENISEKQLKEEMTVIHEMLTSSIRMSYK